jgi:hypothetical protein
LGFEAVLSSDTHRGEGSTTSEPAEATRAVNGGRWKVHVGLWKLFVGHVLETPTIVGEGAQAALAIERALSANGIDAQSSSVKSPPRRREPMIERMRSSSAGGVDAVRV